MLIFPPNSVRPFHSFSMSDWTRSVPSSRSQPGGMRAFWRWALCWHLAREPYRLACGSRAECKSFSSFHQVLNRAQWEPSELSRILLQLLVTNLVEEEPIVVGLDDTIERRWGPKIDARGSYRDPVRSSRGHFVKTSGLRWLGFTLLTPLPWKTGIKALPFQTLLAPSERYASKRGLKHKKLTD